MSNCHDRSFFGYLLLTFNLMHNIGYRFSSNTAEFTHLSSYLFFEYNIENILIKKSPFSQDQPEVDEAFEMDLKALEKIASAEKTTTPSTAASDSTEKSTPSTTKSTPVQPTAKTQHQKKQSNGENH